MRQCDTGDMFVMLVDMFLGGGEGAKTYHSTFSAFGTDACIRRKTCVGQRGQAATEAHRSVVDNVAVDPQDLFLVTFSSTRSFL